MICIVCNDTGIVYENPPRDGYPEMPCPKCIKGRCVTRFEPNTDCTHSDCCKCKLCLGPYMDYHSGKIANVVFK